MQFLKFSESMRMINFRNYRKIQICTFLNFKQKENLHFQMETSLKIPKDRKRSNQWNRNWLTQRATSKYKKKIIEL